MGCLPFLYLSGLYISTSNTLLLEDCLLYDDCTGSDVSDKWNTTATCSYGSYKDTPCIVKGSDVGVITPFEMPDNWIATFKAVGTDRWQWFKIGLLQANNSISPEYRLVNFSCSYDSRFGLVNPTYFPYNTNYADVKIIKQDNTLSVYVDDDLKGTATTDTSYKYFGFYGNYTTYMADIKLKSI